MEHGRFIALASARLGLGERRNGIFATSVLGRAFNIPWLFAHIFNHLKRYEIHE